MKLTNSTALATARLAEMFAACVDGWSHRPLDVRIRYSRGQDFSGLCHYGRRRIHVNLGRHVKYPYDIATNLARARSNARCWWRELYRLRVADAYELALFVFLHEFYHWLVRQSGRNTRQKESMCDRFAARVLVDRYGATVRDSKGRPVERETWDFQALERFVARARRLTQAERDAVHRAAAARRPRRPRTQKAKAATPAQPPSTTDPLAHPPANAGARQLLLFALDGAAAPRVLTRPGTEA